MLKHAWLIGLTLALCGAALGAGKTQNPKPRTQNPKPKEPLAVVLSVSGEARIVRAGGKKSEKAQPGARLDKGDTVRALRKSQATLVLSDGKIVEVGTSKRFTLAPSRASNGGGGKVVSGLFSACVAKLRSMADRAEKGAMLTPAVRGKPEETLTLVHPRAFEDDKGNPAQTFVRADAPTFVWTPVVGTQTYHFAILEEGRPLFEKTLEAAAVKSLTVGRMAVFRPPVPNLTPGRSYAWRVEARFAQEAKSETRSFAVLAQESMTKVKEALEGLDASGGRGAARSVVCGAFLESNHLFADAVAEYLQAIATDPKQLVYRQLLADLLDRSELYELAAMYRSKQGASK
jgi:hypothetical protein